MIRSREIDWQLGKFIYQTSSPEAVVGEFSESASRERTEFRYKVWWSGWGDDYKEMFWVIYQTRRHGAGLRHPGHKELWFMKYSVYRYYEIGTIIILSSGIDGLLCKFINQTSPPPEAVVGEFSESVSGERSVFWQLLWGYDGLSGWVFYQTSRY